MIQVYRWDESGVTDVGADFGGGPTDDPKSWLWVDLVGEGPDTLRAVGERFGLDSSIIEESLGVSHLPQIEEHLHEIYLVLRGFATGGGDRLSTPQIEVLIGSRFLVTIRDEEGAGIEAAKERLTSEGNLPVTSPAALLALLALSSGRGYTPLIQELERQVDSLEEMAIRGDPQTAVEAHALRRDVIVLRRALAPQFDVYDDLAESTHPVIDDEARQMFARVSTQHRRALEALESGRALLGSVIDTYRGAVADQTNEIMRVLTVFSAILLPLSLIAGLWGMNFARIPGAGETAGFWILIGVMAILAVGVWVYFARRGFIGAPRLKDLPKAVGLGLYTIGTAPIRVMAGGIKHLGRADDSGA